ncbi:hypothetical protein PXNS11_350147 [Stutzerimonas xanthomarina]|nr:hypothetical protein PXNS11_350147 [Stutzerimonas xanthomarina]
MSSYSDRHLLGHKPSQQNELPGSNPEQSPQNSSTGNAPKTAAVNGVNPHAHVFCHLHECGLLA